MKKTVKNILKAVGAAAKATATAAAVVTMVCFCDKAGSAEDAVRRLRQYAVVAVHSAAGRTVVELGDGTDISPADLSETDKSEATTTATTATASQTSPTDTTERTAEPKDIRKVKEQQMIKAKKSCGNIYVKNGNSKHDIDIKKVLARKPDCTIKQDGSYQVLIIHTHTSEGYSAEDSGTYNKKTAWRTQDKKKSVVAVGDVLAETLNDAGIKTLHITDFHDYPKYNGAYDRTRKTIEKTLKENPSIQMVLDVHRDSITGSDGTKTKPTAVIDGKKAAQVMIISGCNDTGKLDFPHWERNLRMAVQIQKQLADDWDGLARPLYFAPFRYNMDMTPNSLLLEFGTEVNTLEEAKYSAGLTGRSIAAVLTRYIK